MKTLQELMAMSHAELVITVINLQARIQTLEWERDCFEKSAQEHYSNEMKWIHKFVAQQEAISVAQT